MKEARVKSEKSASPTGRSRAKTPVEMTPAPACTTRVVDPLPMLTDNGQWANQGNRKISANNNNNGNSSRLLSVSWMEMGNMKVHMHITRKLAHAPVWLHVSQFELRIKAVWVFVAAVYRQQDEDESESRQSPLGS